MYSKILRMKIEIVIPAKIGPPMGSTISGRVGKTIPNPIMSTKTIRSRIAVLFSISVYYTGFLELKTITAP